MSREVFFIADDFGRDAPTNAAIIAAHVNGALHGASLMMGQAGTEEAVALARRYPTLRIGWHLHLCDSQPLTVPAWPWGRSPARAGWAIGLSGNARALMRREVATQWEKFQATGLRCAFVNTHHHLHVHPIVWATLARVLPADFDGWIRLAKPRYFSRTLAARVKEMLAGLRPRCRWRGSDTVWGMDRTYHMDAAEVRAALATLPAGLHEFMFHPRTVDNDADVRCLRELKTCGF